MSSLIVRLPATVLSWADSTACALIRSVAFAANEKLYTVDVIVLADARELFADAAPAALAAVDALQEVAIDIRRQRPDLDIYFDLAELRGYHYHTGIVFAAYVPGHGQALANGGRYDDVGAVYGRARAATGFATDLKALMDLVPAEAAAVGAISMPDADDPALEAVVGALRSAGDAQ